MYKRQSVIVLYLYCARDLRCERRVDDDERLPRQCAVREAVTPAVRTDTPPQLRQAADRLNGFVCADLYNDDDDNNNILE